MKKVSLVSQRLKYKLGVMYAVMTVIPVLFLLYIILQSIFPSIKLPASSGITITSLIIGLAAIFLMSFAGFLLMYRSFSSLEEASKKGEEFFSQTIHTPVNFTTNDEAEKVSKYFSNILVELQFKVMQANQYAQELAEANRKLANLALKDGLTGFYNQSYIKERLGQELLRAQQFKRLLGVMMIDVDNLKAYNDSCGHLGGDNALKAISGIIAENIRSTDIPARYGGDEFLVILPETDMPTIKNIAEAIRKQVSHHQFPSTMASGKTTHITVSAGVTIYPSTAKTIEDIINQADQALYQSKKDKKDSVFIHNDSLR
jgi:diguanylate cyclase (GGDEF)-like protein